MGLDNFCRICYDKRNEWISFKTDRKKEPLMKTVGDAINFVKWLIDFIQTIFSIFNKKDDEETPEETPEA